MFKIRNIHYKISLFLVILILCFTAKIADSSRLYLSLPLDKLEEQAEEITVELGDDNNEARIFVSRGSGVIVSKNFLNIIKNNKSEWDDISFERSKNKDFEYCVITSAHNLMQENIIKIDTNADIIFEKYQIRVKNSENEYKKYFIDKLILFEDPNFSDTPNIKGRIDIAILIFRSSEPLSFAKYATYQQNFITLLYEKRGLSLFVDKVMRGDDIFLAGFSQSAPRRSLRTDSGVLIERVGELFISNATTEDLLQGGYNLRYKPNDKNKMDAGMSGGPLLDSSGNLIGIHGRTTPDFKRKLGIGIDILLRDSVIATEYNYDE